MIRNVIVHLAGKLPVLVDLPTLPASTDQAVLCTNMRTRDGKRPSFIEDSHGWFLIPMHEMTILELPADAVQALGTIELGTGVVQDESPEQPAEDEEAGPLDEVDSEPLEPDEDLLARIRQL